MKIKNLLIKNTKIIFLFFVIIVFLTFLCIALLVYKSHSFNINNSQTNIDLQKSEYLARRVLLNPTQDDINKIASSSNINSAVDYLFTLPDKSIDQKYQDGITNYTKSYKDTFKNSDSFESSLYTYELIHDPYKAKRKLYYLWENIFSVDAPVKNKQISVEDVKTLHQKLYDDTLGSYISMVQDVKSSYAMDKYLDLADTSMKSPNENFSRELLQLFLMGQFSPLDKTMSNPNYSESDVNSLAFILTGYLSDKQNHSISFNNFSHYNQPKMFLGENYNDPQKVVDYILSKKQKEISEFLAFKILKFYISDNPKDEDVITASKIIVNKNFNILDSIKAILTSDFAYRDEYMNEERYKNPIELVASTYNDLYGSQDYSINPLGYELSDLDFKPYNPGSVFGRDGFNTNTLFLSGSLMDRWIADSSKLSYRNDNQLYKKMIDYLLINSSINTPQDLIHLLENKLYLGRKISKDVNDKLLSFLITNNDSSSLAFNLKDEQYKIQKLPALINLMLVQPEFTMQSGFNIINTLVSKPVNQISNTSLSNTDSKLIIVRIKGGLDYQGLIANTLDAAYKNNRQELALDNTNSIPLSNGYVINKAAESLTKLIPTKEVSFINAVGLPGQVRAHDIAGEQMETGLGDRNGIVTKFLNGSVTSSDLVSITNNAPIIFRGSQSLEIGSGDLALVTPQNINTNAYKFKVLKDILTSRSYPANIGLYYKQTLLIDQVANDDIKNGGTGKAGNDNKQQLDFVNELMKNNIGKVYYLLANGSFDDHANEAQTLDKGIGSLFDNLTTFYNTEKSKYKITIVVFSEFGRTDKINGSKGTDHGMGGGMIVMSNQLKWPEMIGTLNPSQDINNWTDVKIDERDVWSTIFQNIYSIPQDKVFNRKTSIFDYPVTIR